MTHHGACGDPHGESGALLQGKAACEWTAAGGRGSEVTLDEKVACLILTGAGGDKEEIILVLRKVPPLSHQTAHLLLSCDGDSWLEN